MSTLAANNITDAAGTGGPTLANGLTIGTSPLAAPSGSAPSYTCRAWVNFDGTGTPAIRASGNVTSITDNGTGDFTVNFTTAMPDANYSVPSTFSRGGSVTVRLGIVTSKTTSTFKVDTRTFPSGTTSGTLEDFEFNDISVFR